MRASCSKEEKNDNKNNKNEKKKKKTMYAHKVLIVIAQLSSDWIHQNLFTIGDGSCVFAWKVKLAILKTISRKL